MASFNKVILMGRLVAAPELKTTPAGLPVTSFVLAVDRKYSKDGEKKADFITIVAWRQTAEFVCKYFGKGSAIIICGEIQTRSWTDDAGKKRYAPRYWQMRLILSSQRRIPRRARRPRLMRRRDLWRLMLTKICRSDGGSDDRLALPPLRPVPLQGARHLRGLSRISGCAR